MSDQINPAQIAALSFVTNQAARRLMNSAKEGDTTTVNTTSVSTGEAEVTCLGIDVRLWIVGICCALMVVCVTAALAVLFYVIIITMEGIILEEE